MFDALLAANTLVSLGFVYWALRRMIRGQGFFCVVLSAAYMVTNGLFIFTNQIASALWLYDISDQGVTKAIAANSLFILVAASFIATSRTRSPKAKAPGLPVALPTSRSQNSVAYRPNQVLLVFLILLTLAVEARYLFLSGGMERVYKSAEITDRDSVYQLRHDDSLAVGEGKGLFSSLLARELLYPLCAMGLAYLVLVRRRYTYVLLALPLLFLTALTAISSLQRSPLFFFSLVTVLAIVWASLSSRGSETELSFINFKTVFVAVVTLLTGAAIYSYTEAENIYLGLYGLMERSFLITSFSGTTYFDLFGTDLPFQGFGKILGLPSDSTSPSLTIWDVGRAANGFPHTLNANFIATAYASLGFFGVLFISMAVFTICRYLDSQIKNSTPIDRMGLTIINVFVIFEICNGPLINGLISGFGLNVFLFNLLFKRKFIWQ